MTDSTVSPDSKVFTVGPTWRAVGLEMTTEARADAAARVRADRVRAVVAVTVAPEAPVASADRAGAAKL